jgi:hypothetical protein
MTATSVKATKIALIFFKSKWASTCSSLSQHLAKESFGSPTKLHDSRWLTFPARIEDITVAAQTAETVPEK